MGFGEGGHFGATTPHQFIVCDLHCDRHPFISLFNVDCGLHYQLACSDRICRGRCQSSFPCTTSGRFEGGSIWLNTMSDSKYMKPWRGKMDFYAPLIICRRPTRIPSCMSAHSLIINDLSLMIFCNSDDVHPPLNSPHLKQPNMTGSVVYFGMFPPRKCSVQ